MREAMHITIVKTFPSGAYQCSTLYNNEYYQRSFFFYTKREAMAEFRDYVKAESGAI